MRLTLIISSLSSGGAERVISIMANYWVAKEWKITLLTFVDGQVPPFYDLDARVDYIPLDIAGNSDTPIMAIGNNFHRIRTLRKAIYKSKPDVIISFLDITNVITLLATRGLNIPVVVSERNHPISFDIGRIWGQLRQWTYRFADIIVVQTKEVLNYFAKNLPAHTLIIPNPVLVAAKVEDSSTKLLSKYSLIAIGRLEEQKGFDLLLEAFARIKDIHPQWKLTILGEGTLRQNLESLRDRLGLSNRVYFPGRVKNPTRFLQQADIFVMSSRFEGFPNALCEAMACGLPVISTDCPAGPREIIRDGIDGVLVPNEDISALATAIQQLITNREKRKSLALRAPEITARFSLEKIMDKWEALIYEVIDLN